MKNTFTLRGSLLLLFISACIGLFFTFSIAGYIFSCLFFIGAVIVIGAGLAEDHDMTLKEFFL